VTCEHLHELEIALLAGGLRETFRGRPWSRNCREWVYFDVHIPLDAVREAFALDDCVKDHVHRGTHDGAEAGFVCQEHWDAIMGVHPDFGPDAPTFGR
jgi:hypothetical protein